MYLLKSNHWGRSLQALASSVDLWDLIALGEELQTHMTPLCVSWGNLQGCERIGEHQLTHLLVLGHALLGLGQLVALSLLRHGVFIVVGGHVGWLLSSEIRLYN